MTLTRFAFLTALAALPAAAQDMSTARLLPGWTLPNGHYMAGVEIALEPGWKTYWRAPGAGGIPPQFDWTGSTNVASVEVHWPRPEVFETYGLRSVGYYGHVVFPVEVVPAHPGEPMALSLDLFYGVCEEVCVPAQAQSSLDTAQADSLSSAAIQTALDARAASLESIGLTDIDCDLSMQDDDLSFRAELRAAHISAAPYAVIETGREDLVVMPTETRIEDGQLVVETSGAYYGREALEIDRAAIRLTLIGDEMAVEMTGCN